MQWEVEQSQTVPVQSVEVIERALKEGLHSWFGETLCSFAVKFKIALQAPR